MLMMSRSEKNIGQIKFVNLAAMCGYGAGTREEYAETNFVVLWALPMRTYKKLYATEFLTAYAHRHYQA